MNLNEARLSNGIRVVAEYIPTVQSVTVSLWSRCGSRDELPHQHGIAHFLEHMLFKGTPTRNATQIAQEIEGRGGVLNASTGKELTFYYARMLSEHLPVAIQVLSDMFLNPLLDPEDIEREKGVILEEMRMIEDTPDEILHDLVAEMHWYGHPLGRRIIGTAETVSAFTRELLVEFIRTHYRPERIVVAVVGNFETEPLMEALERTLGVWNPAPSQPLPVSDPTPPHKTTPTDEPILVPREVEQVHFAIAYDGVSFHDERRYAQAVLNSLLGGSMFSRLWQEIREKRGLAYEVGSYASPASDGGMFVIYGGTSQQAYPLVQELVQTEIERLLSEAPPEEEVASARNQLKGHRVLALESTQTRAELIGSEVLMRGRVVPPEEVIAKIDAVTPDDIHHLANDLFRNAPTQVAIVPEE
ncbi:MAG: pitrilysin family protein [Fimbriimonadales bacterium]